MQPILSDTLYFQGAQRINLPRLFFSLIQAEIAYKFLGAMPAHQESGASAQEEKIEGEILCLELTPEGYSKFQQVFVKRRFVAVNEGCDRCFWDSRTGLTVHIVLATSDETVPPEATKTAQPPLNRFSTVADAIHPGHLRNRIRTGVFC
jgi:hypothetical protein